MAMPAIPRHRRTSRIRACPAMPASAARPRCKRRRAGRSPRQPQIDSTRILGDALDRPPAQGLITHRRPRRGDVTGRLIVAPWKCLWSRERGPGQQQHQDNQDRQLQPEEAVPGRGRAELQPEAQDRKRVVDVEAEEATQEADLRSRETSSHWRRFSPARTPTIR